ncbi:NuA4-domain-containing protein [Pterulicium gracile]|uniref:Chromatin modification-related protein EAF6 n=1 Tax=Pterulicium gracile TaxID=1884261 RepID=A0A5C3QKS0_9AGAR|nr:NuA4-domain-containing protein [Pterula gracilis]
MSTSEPPPPQYEGLKRDLALSLQKKRALDKQLAQLESKIYTLETAYIQETNTHGSGNIIQGFDGYLKTQATARRKQDVSEQDRIFSESSVTYQRSIDLLGEVDDLAGGDESRAPSQGLINIPAAEPLSAAQTKKLKDREYARRKRAASRAASIGTVSDEEPPQTASTGRRTKRARMASGTDLD